MIKAVIFDLNGVFIKSPKFSLRIKERYGIAEEEFLPVLKEIMGKIRRPASHGAFSYWQPHLKKWEITLSEGEFYDFWFGVEKEDREMLGLAKELKDKEIKVIILSNNLRERTEFYKNSFPHLYEVSDKIYYSWQTGLLKSDPKAYKNVLEENRLKAEECLFFDDSKENVGLANSLGIKSWLYENAIQTKAIIDDELESNP